MFDLKGGVFLKKFFQLKAASVTIYPNGCFQILDSGRTTRARSCIFKASDEESLHIFLFFGWLTAGLRVIAILREAGQTVSRRAIAGVGGWGRGAKS